MFQITHLKFLAFSMLAVLSIVNPVMADPGKAKHKPQTKHAQMHREAGHSDDRRGAGGSFVIESRDRGIIRDYLAQDYRSHCPPGLAKKNNGCLPPGQARTYHIGDTLPSGIYIPVSRDLLGQLSPAPQGYQYVQVDQDVLLLSEATKKIVDAVTLFSAVGQ